MSGLGREEFRYELFPIFEEEAKLFGMPMSNFFNFALLVLVYLMTPVIIGAGGINFGPVYYISGLLIILTLWIFLKSMGKKAYPNFLFAYISQKMMQPKRISSEKLEIIFMSIDQVLKEEAEKEQAEKDKKANNT